MSCKGWMKRLVVSWTTLTNLLWVNLHSQWPSSKCFQSVRVSKKPPCNGTYIYCFTRNNHIIKHQSNSGVCQVWHCDLPTSKPSCQWHIRPQTSISPNQYTSKCKWKAAICPNSLQTFTACHHPYTPYPGMYTQVRVMLTEYKNNVNRNVVKIIVTYISYLGIYATLQLILSQPCTI